MSRIRRNIYIEYKHAKSVDALAITKRVSKSSIVAAALAAYFSPDAPERYEVAFTRRLDRLSHQFERIERDQSILIEAFALYLLHHFAITAPIPQAHEAAARAQGHARFDEFIEQLAKRLSRGQRLARDVFQDIAPHEPAASEAQATVLA